MESLKAQKKVRKGSKRVQMAPEEVGNTDPQPLPLKSPKKTRSSSKKHWCFTFHEWNDKDIIKWKGLLNRYCVKWIFGDEVGKSGETPHLQGYMELKIKQRLTSLKKWFNKCHWEPTNNIDASIEYCQKEARNIYSNFDVSVDLFEFPIWYDWQVDIIDLVKIPANNRTVHWYWKEEGNVGKSTLCRYLVMIENALIIQGKSSDIFHQIAKRCEMAIKMDIVIIDIPRCSYGSVSYSAIECIKNGLIMSGKYEGGQFVFKSPHLIIFANEPPEESKLSEDRWHIVEI